MGISANTLFHFTSYDNLLGILKNGFYPRCSVEQVAFSNDDFPVAIPMVSFCDIKFSQLTDHLGTYGHYAIGLTKKWGISKGINPIFYMERDTTPHKLIKMLVKAYFKLMDKEKNVLKLTEPQKNEFIDLLQMISYCKINNTKKWDKKKECFIGENINFYDEREWRYLPGVEHSNDPTYLLLPFVPLFKEKYDCSMAIMAQDKSSQEKPLTFSSEDIKYIVVNTDDEVEELISFMRSNNLFQGHFDILISKINSVQRISEDH